MKSITIKHARRKFRVARDDDGVPHIEADHWLNALYGLGYMHALDRPTQLLFSRTMASGRATEHIADTPELLETDRFFRRAGLFVHLDREVEALDDLTFRQITAYCEGVNDGLKQAGRSLPMWATRYQPQPWDQRAVVLVGNLLNYGGLVVSQQQNERLVIELVQSGIQTDMLRELFRPYLDDADISLLSKLRISNRLSDEALELLTDLPRLAGSNAWAVAPSRSATGHALLASDPHLEVNRLPAVWYEIVLRWGDEYALGASLPGCPLIGVGRNRRLAWGVTYMKADTSDFFIEDCRRQGERWQYRRDDQWQDFAVREEHLHRKGGEPEVMRILHNEVGTLERVPEEDGLYLSSAWTGQVPGSSSSFVAWLGLTQCPNVEAARQLVRDCPQPTLHWIFADADGHIGRQASGLVPRRAAGVNGLIPNPAWDSYFHWKGWLASSELPGETDPACGYVATANESPDPPDVVKISTQPLSSYRVRRIRERLEQLPQATLADMQQLQYDVVSTQAGDLLRVFLPHLVEGEIRDRLAAWDRGYDPQSLDATLFQRLYRNVLLEVFGHGTAQRAGIGWRRMLYLCSRAGFSMMIVTCVDRLLKQQQSLWWANRDLGPLIRLAAAKLESEPDQAWSVTNAFRFTNRFVESQFVGRALGFHTSELPMRGCHATPFQGHLLRAATRETTFAPSYHFTTDMGQHAAWTNLPGGASESWISRWYKNDISRWLEGRYKRVEPAPLEP